MTFKEKMEEFLQGTAKDKVRTNLDENSMSVSIGCDINHIEAEKIRTMIKNANESYKVCIIHTCTAYGEFIDITKDIIKFVSKNLPKSYKLFLAGCGVDSFAEEFPKLTIISGNAKFNIESYDIPKVNDGNSADAPMGIIQIQTGCNNQCSYCQFPMLKGHQSVSTPKEDILELVRYNINNGVRDVTLTGVNICQYKDPNDETDLIELLKYIIKNTIGLNKLSMYSIDPAYQDIFKLIDYIEEEPLMSKDLYLASQSGSDKVLKKMNRRHNSFRMQSIINYVKNVKLRHDFIIGHPGEEDEDFQSSLQLLRQTQENDIVGGIAEFYPHEGTASYYMEDKVDPEVSHQRYEIMTNTLNKITTLINQEVRCIQFELWHNCTNECEFCYLNGCRKYFMESQKQAAIKKVMDILETDKPKDFNAIGLIGGELFMGQQGDETTQNKFQELIRKIKTFLDNDEMKEVWLTSNLLTNNLGPLIETLEILMEKLPKYQRIMLCTSYDTEGRFHSEESYTTWYNNLLKIHELFPRLCIHIQSICTQALVNEWLSNKEKFVDFIDRGFLIDFKPPATNAVDFIYNNTGHDSYRENLEKFAKTQNYKYLIDSREKFMKFWEVVYETFPDGLQKLRDFISNKVKSECCYSVPWDEWFENRWYNNTENAPCGHCWDGYCYKDQPDKCAKCDVEKFIKMMEKK